MQKRKLDGTTASVPNNDKELGTENNGADGDGKKQDREIGVAEDVKGSHNNCDSYCDGDDSDGEDGDSDDEDDCDGDDVDVVIDYQKGQQELAKFICSTGFPDIVLPLKKINPSLPLKFGSIRLDCLKTYNDDKLRIKHILKNMDGQISLSVDVLRNYKCSGLDDEFVCIAAHFINDRWELKKWVLGFRCLSDENDEILHSAALKTLKDWDIESKISSVTLAESHVYSEMVQEMKDGVEQKTRLQLDGKLFCVKCCAEMFKLMADSAYKEIPDIIDKVSLLISWKFAPVWYLTAFKLKEALELESLGEFSSQSVRDFYDVPSADEWEKVKCICKLVESAEAAAKTIFETKYPTANIFLRNLEELRAVLFKETINSDEFTSKVSIKMLRRLDKYLEDMFFVLSIASVMDPRLKMKYIDYLSSKRESRDGNPPSALVLNAIHSVYSYYEIQDLKKGHSASDSMSSDSEEDELTSCTEKGGGSINSNGLQEYCEFVESDNKPLQSDLDRYLDEPVLSWSHDFSVLKWWRAESPKYRILSKMARDFLAIPISVATSYDAFSTIPREVDPHVSGGPALRDALMCTRTWDLKR